MIIIALTLLAVLVGGWTLFCLLLAMRDCVTAEIYQAEEISQSEALRQKLFEIELYRILNSNNISYGDYANKNL